MPHWSVADEPAEPVNMVDIAHDAVAEPTAAFAAVANPPPLAPVERVVESGFSLKMLG